MTWSSVTPAGMLPLERSHHSAVLFGHHMVIFGGLADTGQRLNDVHILDLGMQLIQSQNQYSSVPMLFVSIIYKYRRDYVLGPAPCEWKFTAP